MIKKLITSVIFAIILIVFVTVSYLCIGKGVTDKQAIAIWFTAFGILIACGLSFLFADSKPITSTISIIYVVLSIALGATEMVLKSEVNGVKTGGMDAKWTVIIQLVLLAFYVIACLLVQGSSNKNDYEKDENGKNIYKKAG